MNNISSLRKRVEKLLINNYPNTFSQLSERLMPTIGIRTETLKENGVSKFGGLPDVPEDFVWPTFNGRPLSFFAQIYLDELKELGSYSGLPSSGILYFFMETDRKSDYPSTQGQYKVIYNDLSKDQLIPSNENNTSMMLFKEAGMVFYPHYTILQKDEDDMEFIDLILEVHSEICELTNHNDDGGHQIQGFPFSVQDDASYSWAFRELGYTSYELTERQKYARDNLRKEFCLLLQIGFDDKNSDFSRYGGDGLAYFGITKSALEEKDFSKTRLVCQND